MDTPTLPAARPPSLLDAVLAATPAERAAANGLAEFLRERSPWQALAWWLRRNGPRDDRPTRRAVVARLTRDIARLDALLTAQVNAILHHPTFQQLEASWRGLHDLVGRAAEADNVKVRVLHLTWRELVR